MAWLSGWDSDGAALIRVAATLVMLVGGAVLDIRSRRVRNRYWYPFVALAAVFFLADLAKVVPAGPEAATRRLEFLVGYGVAALMVGVCFLGFYFHVFGGADAKAFMVMAFLTPWPIHPGPWLPPTVEAIAAGSLFTLVVPFVYLAWNLVRGECPLPQALIGRPMPLGKARTLHVWPMQDIDAAGQLVWRVWPLIGTDMEARYARLERANVTRVWTTAKIPLLAAIAAGYALVAFGADPLVLLLEALARSR